MHNKGRSTVLGYCQEAESTGLADKLNWKVMESKKSKTIHIFLAGATGYKVIFFERWVGDGKQVDKSGVVL